MSIVDSISRQNSEKAVRDGMAQMAVMFKCESDWLRVAGSHFVGALVGSREAPAFTADQITAAFKRTMEEYKYATPPKPANVAEYARALLPLPPMQKLHNDPLPQRRWTDEQRKTNIAKIEAMQAFLTSQEPEFNAALAKHGYGSKGIRAVQAKHKAELRAFIA